MTNNELITVSESFIGGETVNSVNARDLHDFLEVRTNFSDWIKKRIFEYDFANDSDYLVLSNRIYNGIGNAPIDYWLSLDMAKELSMVERNDKGKQARKYFIECEKKAKGMLTVQDTPELIMAKAIKFAEAKIKMLEHVVTKTAPAVDFRNYATKRGTQWTITDAKNELEIDLVELQTMLRAVGFFYLRRMVRNNRLWPKGKYVDCGYVVELSKGPNYAFTDKGMEFLRVLTTDGIIKAEAMFEVDRQPDLFEGAE